MSREVEATVANSGADAIAALTDARVGQAHHPKERQAKSDVHFDVHRTRIDAEDGRTLESRKHARAWCKRDAACPVTLSH
jgi:hypothetical protein